MTGEVLLGIQRPARCLRGPGAGEPAAVRGERTTHVVRRRRCQAFATAARQLALLERRRADTAGVLLSFLRYLLFLLSYSKSGRIYTLMHFGTEFWQCSMS